MNVNGMGRETCTAILETNSLAAFRWRILRQPVAGRNSAQRLQHSRDCNPVRRIV